MSKVIKIKGPNEKFHLQKFLRTETPYFLEHILLFHVAPENLGPNTAQGCWSNIFMKIFKKVKNNIKKQQQHKNNMIT